MVLVLSGAPLVDSLRAPAVVRQPTLSDKLSERILHDAQYLSPLVAGALTTLTDLHVAGDFQHDTTLKAELRQTIDSSHEISNTQTVCSHDCGSVYQRIKSAIEFRQVFSNCTTVTGLHSGPIQKDDLLIIQELLWSWPRLVQRAYADVTAHGESPSEPGTKHFHSVWSKRSESVVVGGYGFFVDYNISKDEVNLTYVRRFMGEERRLLVAPWQGEESLAHITELLAAAGRDAPAPNSPWDDCNRPRPDVLDHDTDPGFSHWDVLPSLRAADAGAGAGGMAAMVAKPDDPEFFNQHHTVPSLRL